MSRAAIHDRVRRGALFRRYHGVYSLSPGELSREGEWTAALMAAGEGATLSDVSASVLSRIWRYPEEAIDITLPRRHVPIPGVRLHQRKLDPLDVFVFNGIRVTTVARTLVDLTDKLLPEELTNVIHEAAFRNLFDLDATRRAMARARRRLVVEIDGGHHRRPPPRREDERRDAELRAAGWSVMRIGAGEIEQRRERVLRAVGCALARPPDLSNRRSALTSASSGL